MKTKAFDFETTMVGEDITRVGADKFIADNRPTYIAFAGASGAEAMRIDVLSDAEKWICQRMDEADCLVAHNASFDMLVLMHYFPAAYQKAQTKRLMCSKSAAGRVNMPTSLDDLGNFLGLGGKTGNVKADMFSELDWMEYVKRDAALCYDCWTMLEPAITPKEFSVIDEHIRMQCVGVALDIAAIEKGVSEAEAYEAAITKKVQDITGGLRPTQAKFLGEWFEKRIGIKSASKKVLLASEAIDTDKAAKRVAMLLDEFSASEKKKLLSALRHHVGGVVRATLKCNSTINNRWSGSGAHFHNAKRGGIYRKATIPFPGRRFFVADFSQIEVRVGLWVAGLDKDLQDLHTSDWYMKVKDEIYGQQDTEAESKEMRRRVKQGVLGTFYAGGIAAVKRAIGSDCTYEDARFVHSSLNRKLVQVVDASADLLNTAQRAIKTGDPYQIETRNGFPIKFVPRNGRLEMRLPVEDVRIYYHDVELENQGFSYKAFGRKERVLHRGTIYEHCCCTIAREALASIVGNLHNFRKQLETLGGYDTRVATTIHDEPVFESRIDKDAEPAVGKFLLDMMRNALPDCTGLLLDAEGQWKDCWG